MSAEQLSDILDTLTPTQESQSLVKYQQQQQQSKPVKKRKMLAAALSSGPGSEDDSSNQDTAYYLQKAVEYLELAAAKEENFALQDKIAFLVTKTNSILVYENDAEMGFEDDFQSQLQEIKSDVNAKFNAIQTMISGLQSTSASTAAAATAAATAAANAAANTVAKTTSTASLNGNFSKNSAQTAGKKTYAQAAGTNVTCSPSADIQSPQNAVAEGLVSSNLARGQSRTQQTSKNSKKNSNTKLAEKNSVTHRDRRLILLNSKNSTFDSMKTRDLINQTLQKELNLITKEPILAAITRSQNQQNIVLTTTS